MIHTRMGVRAQPELSFGVGNTWEQKADATLHRTSIL
jgi:hypothetical protein